VSRLEEETEQSSRMGQDRDTKCYLFIYSVVGVPDLLPQYRGLQGYSKVVGPYPAGGDIN